MSIGYACIALGIDNCKIKSLRLKNADRSTLYKVITNNLDTLDMMLEYNKKNFIKLMRTSSDIIPFGSHHINNFEWWKDFQQELESIGEKLKNYNIRTSMHPGQYSVLNSPDKDIVSRTISDLTYHCKFLKAIGTDNSNKIIIHVGGCYGDKKESLIRFINNYNSLDQDIKKRIVIENDENRFNIDDVLNISNETGIPVVYDVFHDILNPGNRKRSQQEIINECRKTWKNGDGVQKIHYSQQGKGSRGAHSDTIEIKDFVAFYENLPFKEIDIMLEVKDKNLSALKCIHCTDNNTKKSIIENQWGKYKYLIMSKSYKSYKDISSLINNDSLSPLDFYKTIDTAMKKESESSNELNTLLHIWGYFKRSSTNREKDNFFKKLNAFKEGKNSVKTVKTFLFDLAKKYNNKYLMESYYFFYNEGGF